MREEIGGERVEGERREKKKDGEIRGEEDG